MGYLFTGKRGTHVKVPDGNTSTQRIQLQVLIKNQEELGWEYFLFGRVCHGWKILQRQETDKKSRKCETALQLFWSKLFSFYCSLWRDRCHYVELIKRELDDNEVNADIEIMKNRDWSVLER